MRRIAFISLWLTVFCIPWENVLTVPGVGTITRFIGAFALLTGMLAMLAARRVRLPSALLVAALPFLLWSTLTYFWTVDHDLTTQRILTNLQLLALAWLVWEFSDSPAHLRGLLQAYVLGAFAAVASTLQNYAIGHHSSYMRFAATGWNPDDLGLTLALAIPLAWYLSLEPSRTRGQLLLKWIDRVYLPPAAMAIILTASRTSFVNLFVASSMILWTFPRLTARMRLGVLALALATGFGAANLPASSWARIGTTVSDLQQGDMGKRSSIWKSGFEVAGYRPFIGNGAGAFRVAIAPIHGEERAPHNTFLSVLVEHGFIGFALFGGVLFFAVLSLMQLPPVQRHLWLVILATWTTGVMTMGWETRKPTWLIFVFVAADLANAAALRRSTPDAAGSRWIRGRASGANDTGSIAAGTAQNEQASFADGPPIALQA